MQTEDDGKGHRPDLIIDDGGEMTLLIHEVKKAEDLLLKDGTIPDPRSIYNAKLKISKTSSSATYRAETRISGPKLSIRVW